MVAGLLLKVGGEPVVGVIWRDLRYAVRAIMRAPFLSFVVLLALSAGIGLNAAVFALVETSWFRPPVEKDPASFIQVIPSYTGWFSTEKFFTFTVNDYEAFRTRARSLQQVAGYTRVLRRTLDDDMPRFGVGLVTCNFFDVYGWGSPVKGRLFLPEECATPGSAFVAVINEGLWRDRYSADPHIIGQVIHIDHRPFTVVGVLAVRAPTWMREDVWVPYTAQPEFWGGYDGLTEHPHYPWLRVAGRLEPGYSRANAQAELKSIENQQDNLEPGRRTALLVTNGSGIQDPNARSLGLTVIPLVFGPMVLILLVACTNVTMLLLSHAAERRGEVAIRVALGAGRRRLLRMLATEGLPIAAAAGVVSVYLARQLPSVLWNFLLREDGYQDLAPDWKVFAYLAGVTLVAGLIAGLAPARESVKVDLLTSLKGQEGTATRSRKRSALIIAQMAMSFLIVAAGVMFLRIQRSITADDRGFDMRHVFVVPLSVPSPKYTPESAAAFYRTVRERVLEIPGVSSASYTDTPPFIEPPSGEIRLPGEAKGQGKQVVAEQVSTDFFATMGIPILHGRAFRDSDAAPTSTSAVAIVSRSFATAFWHEQNPLAKGVVLPDNNQVPVVGVVGDVESSNFDNPNKARLYLPQSPQAFTGPLLVRFDGEPATVAPVISKTGFGPGSVAFGAHVVLN